MTVCPRGILQAPQASSRCSPARYRRSGGPVIRSVIPVLLLARFDADGKNVPLRRERARGVGREGARGVVGPVEVERHPAVRRKHRVEKAARATSIVAARLVLEDEEELL